MGGNLQTTLSMALAGLCVPGAGPFKLCLCLDLQSPKGCSMNIYWLKYCMGRSQQPCNRCITCARHPHFSGEHVEAHRG